MPKPKLPDLHFVVEELILEGRGGPSASRARTLAEALETHVSRGASLARHRKALAKAAGGLTDRSARVRTIRVLAQEAAAAGADDIVAMLEKIAPGTGARLARAADRTTAKQRADLCLKVARGCLAGKAPKDSDLARIVGWLGTPAEGRGHARVDVGRAACIGLMRVITHADAAKKTRGKLEAMLADDGAAPRDARRALVAAAAYDERWNDVDALSKVKGASLASVVDGLGLAIGYRLSDRPPKQARAERGAPLPKFRPHVEKRVGAVASKGPPALKKDCERALARLARGR
jgi:hypothetical protein